MKTRLRTRSELLRLAPVVLAVVALACAPGAEEGVPEAGPATDDLLTLLPGDAVLVGWMDLDAMRESASGSALFDEESSMPGDEDYDDLRRFAEATGIEMEDIHQGALAIPAGAADTEEPEAMVVLRVDYDPARMTEALAGRPTITYRERTLYELDPSMWSDEEDEEGTEEEAEGQMSPEESEGQVAEEDEADRPHLVMVDTGTLLLGNESGVRVALDTIDGEAASLRDNAAMTAIIDDAAVGSQAWMVVVSEAWSDRLEELPEGGMPVPRSAIEGLEHMTVSMSVEEGFLLRMKALAGNQEDAGLLADSLRGVVAMGKMMIQQQPEIFAILDEGIQVDSDGREIRLEARLTEAQIEALRQYAEEQIPAEAGSSGGRP